MIKRLVLLISLFLATPVYGQIDASRKIDWTHAGVTGGIPTRTTICTTLSAGATVSQINSAIAACPSGQVVKLSAGSYTLGTGIDFAGKSNVTLRGAGPDQTKLVFTGSTACGGQFASICLASNDRAFYQSTDTNTAFANWTAGYAKGTTTITLSTVSGLSVGQTMLLDQLDDSTTDTGTIWVCQTPGVCTVEGTAGGRSNRAQIQVVRVTGIAGSDVTFTPELYMPNWRSNRTPQVNKITPLVSSGVEDLSIDNGANGGFSGITILNAYNCWVKNIRSVTGQRNHIWIWQSGRITIRDSYFYGTVNAASQSYGVETRVVTDVLVENNIFQHITSPMMTGNGEGIVYGYNYSIDDYYNVTAWMQPSSMVHDAGVDNVLWESNDGSGTQSDEFHGTSHFVTAFRNRWNGWETGKSNNTMPVQIQAFHRYYNILGNVLGESGYHTAYEKLATSGTSNGNLTIFVLGWAGQVGTTASIPSDPKVWQTMMRWGNYDVATGTSRFLSSEVPSGLSLYANPVPSDNTLPSSYYLSSKPSFYGSATWPSIGPDVSGGNITNVGGHAYKIPARTCWESLSGDPAYAGGATVRVFNADTCYASSPTPPPTPTHIFITLLGVGFVLIRFKYAYQPSH